MSAPEITAPQSDYAANLDPRALLLRSPMSRCQMIAVAITVALCALDGFDILAITFAASGIVASWGISKAQLGIVFGVGLIGVAAGSLLIGPLADLVGRRLMIIGCLILLALGMYVSAYANSIVMLTLCRLVTGLGIGAMVATTNPLAAEYANAQRRDMSVGWLNIGFPLGGVLGGAFVAWLLRHYDWRAIFIFGGSLSVLMLPLVLLYLPEPLGFLIEQRGPRALERVNVLLRRCGHAAIVALPAPTSATKAGVARLAEIFGRSMIRTTLHIAAIFFFNIIAIFYMLSWMPQMVAGLGFSASEAASVSVMANLSGVAGGMLLGWYAARFGVKRLTLLAMLGVGVCTALFGFAPADIGLLRLAGGIAGFFIFASMIGLYSIISRSFPTYVRATGTGLVIGIGRVGSALAPVVAGLLFTAGVGRGPVSMLMGVAAVLAAVLLAAFTVRAPAH